MSSQGTARQIGQTFADAVRREPRARRLWVSVRHDVVSLWLLTDALDLETERGLYQLLDSTVPVTSGAHVRLHVLNPRHGDEQEMCEIVPDDAAEIALHVART